MPAAFLENSGSVQRQPILGNRSGAAAVELAVALPFVILLLTGLIQGAVILYLRHEMFQLAKDAARGVAVAQFSEADGEAFIHSRLAKWHDGFSVEVDAFDDSSGEVAVAVSIPLADIADLDVFGLFSGMVLATRAVAFREF